MPQPGSRALLAIELALGLAVAVAFADSSIVVLALPELFLDFQTTIPDVSWVVTGYNLAVAVAIVAVVPLQGRVRTGRLAVAGLALFLAASVLCAVAGDLARLVGGRVAQGVGAALVLGASLPVFVALTGNRERAIGIWVGAGAIGTALGPALGGALTSAFDWRAIFIVQAPLAAAALAAALHPRVRALRPERLQLRGRIPLGASVGLALVYAALVGALFLAVVLVVTVWGYGPLAGAGIVSALPIAAAGVQPLSARLPAGLDVSGGSAPLPPGPPGPAL